jgi:hypothetical protein
MFYTSTAVLCRSAVTLSTDFKEYWEKDPNEPFATPAIKNEVEMNKLKTEKLEKLTQHLAAKVTDRINAFLDYLYYLQKRVIGREEHRVKFDHYTMKIKEIRVEFDKTLAAGKIEAQKDKERRERNELKYENAKIDYEIITKRVTHELISAYHARFSWMSPAFSEMVKTQVSPSSSSSSSSSSSFFFFCFVVFLFFFFFCFSFCFCFFFFVSDLPPPHPPSPYLFFFVHLISCSL